MSHTIYFTTDAALAAVLAEAEDELCGRESDQAHASTPATENVVSSDDEESEGVPGHLLDDELDIAHAAAQFNALAIDDAHERMAEDATENVDEEGTDAHDDVEAATAAENSGNVCGCSENWLSKFANAQVEQTQMAMAEMEKGDADMLLIGIL